MLPAACIVPESSARSGWTVPLVALFSPLVHLCPLPETSHREVEPAGCARTGQLISLCPPVPAAAAEKLHHLARSLEGSAGVQHGEQLKQLILESLSAEGTEELSSCLRRQLQTSARDESGSTAAAALLWQERLLLLLADQAEREQEELAAAMDRISRQHGQLLASLGDSPEAVLEDFLPPQAVINLLTWQPRRLLAWARLLAHTAMPCELIWYITRQERLAGQIMEQYQLCMPGQAQQVHHLPELLLPGAPAAGTAAPHIQDCPSLLAAFSRLQAPDGTAEDSVREAVDLFATAAPEWNAMLRAAVPSDTGLCRLQLSILPGTTFLHLLQKSAACTRPAAEGVSTKTTDTGLDLCLFGLLLSGTQESGIRT